MHVRSASLFVPAASANLLARAGKGMVVGSLIAFGALHVVHGAFVTRLIPAPPQPLPSALAYIAGIALIALAAGCLHPKLRKWSTAVLAGTLLFSFLLLHVPGAISGPRWGGQWTNAFKALALSGACFALFAEASHASSSSSRPVWLAQWMARAFFGAFLVLCGIQHFIWAQFVATLVPSWIPGGAFWTYATGAALIAAGIGLVTPRVAHVAAFAAGAMIFVWIWTVHLPRAARNVSDTNEVTAFFEAVAFAGAAWLIYGQLRAKPSASQGSTR